MEFQEKFLLDWKTLFPSSDIPDTSFFASRQAFEGEVLTSQKKVNQLELELRKQEFLLTTLRKYKDDKTFLYLLDGRPSQEDCSLGCQLLSFNEQIPSPNKIAVLDSGNDSAFSTFSSFKPRSNSKLSLNEPDISTSSSPSSTKSQPLNSFSTFKKSLSEDSSDIIKDGIKTDPKPAPLCKPRRHTTNPESVTQKPKPAPRRSLSRNVSAAVKSRKVSLDSLMMGNKTSSNKEQWRKTVGAFLVDLSDPVKIVRGNSEFSKMDEENIVDIDIYPGYSVSSSEDDEHIYTDVSDFQTQFKLPKLANVINDDECLSPKDEAKSKEKKRLGSQDRQAFLFSDDLDVTSPATDGDMSDLNKVLNNSQESLVDLDAYLDEVHDAPEILVESHELEYYDDDEHIYANVNDFCLKAKYSSDNDSDQDFLCGSYSGGIPSPSYREMTSDEIESLQKRNESDDDIAQSQDEEDSDDAINASSEENNHIPLTREQQNSSSEILRSNVDTELTIKRASSSLVKATEGIMCPLINDPVEDLEHIKASRMRKYTVMNLLDSEKCYYDCLDMLVKFMKPLRVSTESSQPILSAADFKAIFDQADDLFVLHKEFLTKLEPRVESWDNEQLIGDLFTIIMNGFNLYLKYIGHYKSAMETISKCRNSNQRFALIMDQDIRIPSMKDPLTLEGLLYKPVDRMTQYSLILNDLLKHTTTDHLDYPQIVEVSGALFDLFEQVNIDRSKKKIRQRHLLKDGPVVEIDDGERRARTLILFNDVIISGKLKPSRDAYVCKWYAALADISLKPYQNSQTSATVPVSSKAECDKLRASVANIRAEIRKEHMPLQQKVSVETSPPFTKRRLNQGSTSRSSSRAIEKFKKKIAEQDRLLQLISPCLPLNIYHKNGKTYTVLIADENERQAWSEALKPRLKRIHARMAESIHMNSIELQQAFETVLKLQRLGSKFAPMVMGATRPMSMDFTRFEEDKESLTGFLLVNITNGKGFNRNSDTYVVLEIDSYGHFFKKAKTKPARGSDPQWRESFEFEIEACNWLRLTTYNKLRLMGDDVSGKVSINLTRENLLDNKNHSVAVSLDRGQGAMNISLCFATSVDGIKKSKSLNQTGVFGIPISIVAKREKGTVPVIVLSCIKEIEERGMEEVGLYRLSGVASEIQYLKKLFNEDTQNALLALPDTDVHAVAGLLKLYFRELPQCLFTGKLYKKFVEGLSITDAEEKELYMCDMLQQLPNVNKLTALFLFEHLRRVVLLETINKMGVNNLATVFGPTVLRSSTNDKENDGGSCNVGTFDIGALDVMSQVGIFRYFLSLKNNKRTKLPEENLELWRRLDPEKASQLEEKLLETAEEHLI